MYCPGVTLSIENSPFVFERENLYKTESFLLTRLITAFERFFFSKVSEIFPLTVADWLKQADEIKSSRKS